PRRSFKEDVAAREQRHKHQLDRGLLAHHRLGDLLPDRLGKRLDFVDFHYWTSLSHWLRDCAASSSSSRVRAPVAAFAAEAKLRFVFSVSSRAASWSASSAGGSLKLAMARSRITST